MSNAEAAKVVVRHPKDLTFHSVVELFPPMSEFEFDELVEDIRVNGQQEAVWIDTADRVIDGRNRVEACAKLNRKVEVRLYDGSEDGLVSFVLSMNLKRRQLRHSQRALVAARLANLKRGTNQHTAKAGTSIADAAEQLGVGRDSVERAIVVLRAGVPELVEAVTKAKVSVSAAAEVATLEKEAQREAVYKGPAEMKRLAKVIRGSKSENQSEDHKMGSAVPAAPPAIPPESNSEWCPVSDAELDSIERIRLELVVQYLSEASAEMQSVFDAWWRQHGVRSEPVDQSAR